LVIWLNIVDLPTLGRPIKATTGFMDIFYLTWFYKALMIENEIRVLYSQLNGKLVAGFSNL